MEIQVIVLRILPFLLYSSLVIASSNSFDEEEQEPKTVTQAPVCPDICTEFSSPNCSSREGTPIDSLIMHYTALGFEASLKTLTAQNSTNPVSSHYLIDECGKIFQLVPDTKKAWHAGVSFWRNQSGMNICSLGIEIVNMGNTPFPTIQMESVRDLSLFLSHKYNITPLRILGHSDVAPTRKQDPGALFDWEWLAEQGVGVNPKSLDTPIEKPFQFYEDWSLLNTIGYEPLTSENRNTILKAFQRHYVRHNVTGEPDDQTITRMVNLAKLVEPESTKLKLSGNEPR